ncbi:hypothetical protein [Gordonia shandongensis]|uniref:hypothetical protein n=1 Tax=Gordonia shandongensis TaxID=376351 RepID=UPI0012EBB377|nr:hypothetical protein [Gordonia shandongensis]
MDTTRTGDDSSAPTRIVRTPSSRTAGRSARPPHDPRLAPPAPRPPAGRLLLPAPRLVPHPTPGYAPPAVGRVPSPPWQVTLVAVWRGVWGLLAATGCLVAIALLLGTSSSSGAFAFADTSALVTALTVGLVLFALVGAFRAVAAFALYSGRPWAYTYTIATFVIGVVLNVLAVVALLVLTLIFGVMVFSVAAPTDVPADAAVSSASVGVWFLVPLLVSVAGPTFYGYLIFCRRTRGYFVAAEAHRGR